MRHGVEPFAVRRGADVLADAVARELAGLDRPAVGCDLEMEDRAFGRYVDALAVGAGDQHFRPGDRLRVPRAVRPSQLRRNPLFHGFSRLGVEVVPCQAVVAGRVGSTYNRPPARAADEPQQSALAAAALPT